MCLLPPLGDVCHGRRSASSHPSHCTANPCHVYHACPRDLGECSSTAVLFRDGQREKSTSELVSRLINELRPGAGTTWNSGSARSAASCPGAATACKNHAMIWQQDDFAQDAQHGGIMFSMHSPAASTDAWAVHAPACHD